MWSDQGKLLPRVTTPRELVVVLGCPRPHLGVEPGLHVSAVVLHQGLILASHIFQNLVEIHRGGSVHLHIQSVPKLATECVDFLERRQDGIRW